MAGGDGGWGGVRWGLGRAWRRAPLEQIQAGALIAQMLEIAVATTSPGNLSLGRSCGGGGEEHCQWRSLSLSKACGYILLALMVRKSEPRGRPASSEGTGGYAHGCPQGPSSLEASVLSPPCKSLCLIDDPAQNFIFEHRGVELERAQNFPNVR